MTCVFVHPKIARWQRMRQAVMTGARLHSESGPVHRSVFLTCTYREGVDWEPGHIRQLQRHIRDWARVRDIVLRVVWVLEFTKRGRPHYHVMASLPKALSLPKPDKRGWWPHGMTKTETARNPVGYMAKYMTKGGETCFSAPRGARICGVSGLTACQRDEKSWWMKPKWVREVFGIADRPLKVKGGYLARSTGEYLKSPWRILERGPKWSWFEFTDDPPDIPVQRST